MANGRASSLSLLRRRNERAIVRALFEVGPQGGLTRNELEPKTGLARATVAALISDLRRDGVLEASGDQRGGAVKLRPRAGFAFGVHLDHHHIHCGIADPWGKILRSSPPQKILVDERAEESLNRVAATLEALLKGRGTPDDVIGVGIGLAAPVDPSGLIREGMLGAWRSSMLDWLGLDVPDRLHERLTLGPAHLLQATAPQRWGQFQIANDANLGALAALRQLHREGRDDVNDLLYVRWDNGIGMGLVLGGQVQAGFGGLSGEIGHLPIPGLDPQEITDEQCQRCGAKDCLEVVGSWRAMRRRLLLSEDEDLPLDNATLGEYERLAPYVGRVLAPIVTAVNPGVVMLAGPPPQLERVIKPLIRQELLQGLAPAAADADVMLSPTPHIDVVQGAIHDILDRHALDFLISAKLENAGEGETFAGHARDNLDDGT